MQLLESSDLGLRAARISLKSPFSPIRVTLFPMVHIGEPDFYRAVYADAFSHDVVLVEGVHSPIVRRITRSYRWIVNSERIGLSVQSAHPRPTNRRAQIVHADLSGDEFEAVWRKIPIWMRAAMNIAVPIVGLRHRWFGSRQSLASGMSLEDLPRREEVINWDPEFAAIDNAIVAARDIRLVERLSDQLDQEQSIRRVAVVYGARHMRAVLHELTGRRRFYAETSDWLTVFPLEKPLRALSPAAPT